MADPEQFNADQLAFWNGAGGHTWVARQEHTDITLAPVMEALLAFAAPGSESGCWISAVAVARRLWKFARAVGPAGRVAALDISGPMLAEGQARADAAGIANVDWRQADAATARVGRIRFADVSLRHDVLRRPGGGLRSHAPRRQPWRANGIRVLSAACREPVDGGADERGRLAICPRGRNRSRTPLECSPSPTRSGSLRFSPQPAGAAAVRQARPGPRHRRWPRAGGGCGSVDPNRRVNSWLRNQPAEVIAAARRVPPRALDGTLGRRERTPARCDVVGQQRSRLSKRRPTWLCRTAQAIASQISGHAHGCPVRQWCPPLALTMSIAICWPHIGSTPQPNSTIPTTKACRQSLLPPAK